jgi:threonine dehydrogenase-like Zn-dependent dehydrogenase
MRAVTFQGTGKMEVMTVPDPKIINPRDAIVQITSTCICGSDLHLFDGYIPTVRKGDIMGHEFMGIIVEIGSAVKNLQKGDRVVVPFAIACGNCYYCQNLP